MVEQTERPLSAASVERLEQQGQPSATMGMYNRYDVTSTCINVWLQEYVLVYMFTIKIWSHPVNLFMNHCSLHKITDINLPLTTELKHVVV